MHQFQKTYENYCRQNQNLKYNKNKSVFDNNQKENCMCILSVEKGKFSNFKYIVRGLFSLVVKTILH